VYDPDTDTFRRFQDDGDLTEPVTPPWGQREADAPAVVQTLTDRPRGCEPPPWTPFAVGGGAAGLLLMVGAMVQRKRQ
jgi:hypothetical protein